jgi:hypothetical protein
MKTYEFEGIQFEESDVYEFDAKTFKIVFDESGWYAESLDPYIDEDIIVIEDDTFKLEKDLELFDSYVLTTETFNKLKEKIQ